MLSSILQKHRKLLIRNSRIDGSNGTAFAGRLYFRSELTTAILPVFQEVTFKNDVSAKDAAKMLNDVVQKTIDENQ